MSHHFNSDNVYDILMTRVTNRPISSGFEPCQPRATFPYVNEPRCRTDINPVIDLIKISCWKT
jgi:hypothetical protein